MTRAVIIIAVLLTFACASHADTTFVADSLISGHWTADHSPYMIQNTVTVPVSDTLTIGPSVTVYFTGGYRFNVRGLLRALGTATDTIRFTTDTLANQARWRGVRFLSASDSCRMDYCLIENGHGTYPGDDRYGGGIECQTCSPIFNHCAVRLCYALLDGGGVYCRDNSAPAFFDCEISGCTSHQGNGGGLFGRLSFPQLTRCTISHNSASATGGGLGLVSPYGNVVLNSCNIQNNLALDGGGLFVRNRNYYVSLMNCTISGNGALRGGGVFDTLAAVQYSYCVFYANIADSGAAIFSADTSRVSLNFCTLSNNQSGTATILARTDTLALTNSIISFTSLGSGITFMHPRSVRANFNDVYGNELQSYAGDVPTGLGSRARVNRRADSCDAFFNISVNPQFYDSVYNFHLTAPSHCIDVADTSLTHDPDGTFRDMGAYYFPQPGHPPLPFALIAPADDVAITADTASFVWHQSIEPDYWDRVYYTVHMAATDTALTLPAAQDTVHIFDIHSFRFPNNSVVHWWVEAHSLYPDTSIFSDTFRFVPSSGDGISDGGFIHHPSAFILSSSPNPFNPVTDIRFDIPQAGQIKLSVFDVLGREVATLIEKRMAAGSYTVQWNADAFPSGMYFAVLQAGDKQKIQKLLLLK